MFGNDENAMISWHGHTDWWYVEKRGDKSQCLYLSEDGKAYYGEKQLSIVVPMVFNNRQTANRVARRQKGGVRKYPYRLSSGTR